jgi:ferredoxin-type protein NapH
LILKHGWCGHLCPLGAFWSTVGRRTAQVRVRFDAATCTHCGECAKVCPEPQVLNLKRLEETGFVFSGECSNCGRCTPICPEGSLSFDLRPLIRRHNASAAQTIDRQDVS